MGSRSVSVTIDPVRDNITNRISGGRGSGELSLQGGLLLEGHYHGSLSVNDGPFVVMAGALATGRIEVHGNCLIFGQIGMPEDSTQLICKGEAHIADGARLYGMLICSKPVFYSGARVVGQVCTDIEAAHRE